MRRGARPGPIMMILQNPRAHQVLAYRRRLRGRASQKVGKGARKVRYRDAVVYAQTVQLRILEGLHETARALDILVGEVVYRVEVAVLADVDVDVFHLPRPRRV